MNKGHSRINDLITMIFNAAEAEYYKTGGGVNGFLEFNIRIPVGMMADLFHYMHRKAG